MKKSLLLPLFMLLCVSAFAQPAGYVPGTQVCWAFNGRDHGYFKAAGNGERHILVFFTGMGQTNCLNYEEHAPQSFLKDAAPGKNWDGRTVRAPGDTIVWEIFTVQNNTFVTTSIYDIEYFLTHIAPIDTSDHSKFHIGGVSLGVGRFWAYIGNAWNETSHYYKIFSTTISESTTYQGENYIYITPNSTGKRHWVWHGRHDSNGNTIYQYSEGLYNALNGNKRLTILDTIAAGHNGYTWDSCMSLAGTDSLTNRWLWMVGPPKQVVQPCVDPGGGPTGYVPGTQVNWQFNNRAHGYFRAEGCGERHVLVAFTGNGETNSTNYQNKSPQKLLEDLGLNWNGKTVRAPGDTIVWTVFTMLNNSYVPTTLDDMNYFFANLGTNGIDTSQHARFHIAGIGEGGGRMWDYLTNSWSLTSPYRQVFSTTLNLSAPWLSNNSTAINAYSIGRRHWVWAGALDTYSPSASAGLFGVLGGEKQFRLQAGAQDAAAWDSAYSLAGTDSSTNRWLWMVMGDTTGSSLLLNNELSYKSSAEIVAKKTFSLFPNPTSSFVRLNFEAVPRVTYRVTVLDVNGRVVHVEAGVNPAQQLDVTKLPKGLYILQLEGGGSKVQQKFIKQ